MRLWSVCIFLNSLIQLPEGDLRGAQIEMFPFFQRQDDFARYAQQIQQLRASSAQTMNALTSSPPPPPPPSLSDGALNPHYYEHVDSNPQHVPLGVNFFFSWSASALHANGKMSPLFGHVIWKKKSESKINMPMENSIGGRLSAIFRFGLMALRISVATWCLQTMERGSRLRLWRSLSR